MTYPVTCVGRFRHNPALYAAFDGTGLTITAADTMHSPLGDWHCIRIWWKEQELNGVVPATENTRQDAIAFLRLMHEAGV